MRRGDYQCVAMIISASHLGSAGSLQLDLGLHPKTPYSLVIDSTKDVAAVDEFIQKLEALQHMGLESLQKARDRQAESVNKNRPRPREFNVGDMVLLSNKHFRTAASKAAASQKLHGKYSGPFQIVRKVSPNAYELDLPANIKIHPTINIEYLKEYHASPDRLGPRDAPLRPDPLLTSDGSAEYEVERILAHRHDPRKGFTYLVLWKGYGMHDAT